MPDGRNPGPSIKDGRRYEALRGEGMSKEKAARIANSDPKEMARNRISSARYEEWTKSQLYTKARDVGIVGRSSMTKGDLVKALRGPSRPA